MIEPVKNNIQKVADRFCGWPPVCLWLKIKPFINRILMSRYFMLAEFSAACLIIAFGWEEKGAVAFLWLLLFNLVFCNDLLSTTMPLCLMSVFLSKCYNSADVFMGYVWLVIPTLLAIVIHLACYPRKLVIRQNFWGCVAVAVAVTLGGLGTISSNDYFSGVALYYMAFLGVGMALVYLMTSAYLHESRDYNIFNKFAGILYAMGILACFSVVCFYYPEWDTFKETHQYVSFQSGNNLSTMLMIAMPFPCYFSLKNKKHLLGLAAIFICLVLCGSRGGLVMGAIELLVCLIYLCVTDSKSRFTYVCLTLAVLALVYVNVDNVLTLYKIDSLGDLISHDEARYGLLERVGVDFKSNILFGRGIGYTGNEDIYNPVKGAMNWYHMMIPQIIGSLGLLGVAAYAFQWAIRAYTVFRKTDAYKLALGVSYFGLFIMSQVNPGEFCPIPYTLLAVMTFVLAEKYDSRESANI